MCIPDLLNLFNFALPGMFSGSTRTCTCWIQIRALRRCIYPERRLGGDGVPRLQNPGNGRKQTGFCRNAHKLEVREASIRLGNGGKLLKYLQISMLQKLGVTRLGIAPLPGSTLTSQWVGVGVLPHLFPSGLRNNYSHSNANPLLNISPCFAVSFHQTMPHAVCHCHSYF